MKVKVRVAPGWPVQEFQQHQLNFELFTLEARVLDEALLEEATRLQPFMEILPVEETESPLEEK